MIFFSIVTVSNPSEKWTLQKLFNQSIVSRFPPTSFMVPKVSALLLSIHDYDGILIFRALRTNMVFVQERSMFLRLRVCLSQLDRKSTRLNSSHVSISYAVFCLKKKKTNT